MVKVHFTVNYLVKKKEKFQQFLDTYSNTINHSLVELKIKRYWKIPEQLQATFYVSLPPTNLYKTTYQVLQLAQQLYPAPGFNWLINGPYEDGHFECILDNKNERPLKWAHISLDIQPI